MKKYILSSAVLLLLAICGVFFFLFYRMGTHDAKALADFTSAYKHYNQAITDYSGLVLESSPENLPTTGGSDSETSSSLVELNKTAAVRISSLTKNDGELMKLSTEIADLANQEVDALQAYHCAAASQSADAEVLAQQVRDLSNRRQADYATYLKLAGLVDGDS